MIVAGFLGTSNLVLQSESHSCGVGNAQRFHVHYENTVSQYAQLLMSSCLKQPAASYSGIYEVLKSKQSWWHYVGSTWLIATDDTPQGLYDEIGFYLEKGDRLLITTFNRPCQGWLPQKAWDWIHKYE